MSICNKIAAMAMLAMLYHPAIAQEDGDELAQKMRAAEQRLVENERRMEESERERANAMRDMERVRVELERAMKDENIEIEGRRRVAEA